MIFPQANWETYLVNRMKLVEKFRPKESYKQFTIRTGEEIGENSSGVEQRILIGCHFINNFEQYFYFSGHWRLLILQITPGWDWLESFLENIFRTKLWKTCSVDKLEKQTEKI